MSAYGRPRPRVDDLPLFSRPAPAQAHSKTSVAAARAIEGSPAVIGRRQVLDYLEACGFAGGTDEEIQLALDMNPSTERPRRVELVEAGLVRDSGRTRATISNRQAVVWIATRRDA